LNYVRNWNEVFSSSLPTYTQAISLLAGVLRFVGPWGKMI
jgi:hypothetical protein